ncbi:MAG: hypothetical protein JW891_18355 [Candidatus Lokiarchaeota archaeon]|nr:hypothetical protein [Candidatus Lokiarchaeota archaeon]
MFRKGKTQFKFKTYKSDAAPFFFFIDIIPLDPNSFNKPLSSFLAKQVQFNPIMPLPMRVDKVFNGESTVIIRPNEPINFPINDSDIAIINPVPFVQLGFEKLLYFTEIRSQETLYYSLKQKAVEQWWSFTKDIYGNLPQLEEDFSAFLKAYLHTVLRTWLDGSDMIGAATQYCSIINDICKERMLRNVVSIEIDKKHKQVKMYNVKSSKYREKLKVQQKIDYLPELVDIEVFNLSQERFLNKTPSKAEIIDNRISCNRRELSYIPLLFYDDLQECMIQNMKLLENGMSKLLEPSILIDSKAILIKNHDELHDFESKEKYSWLNTLNKLDITSGFESLTSSLNKFHRDFR